MILFFFWFDQSDPLSHVACSPLQKNTPSHICPTAFHLPLHIPPALPEHPHRPVHTLITCPSSSEHPGNTPWVCHISSSLLSSLLHSSPLLHTDLVIPDLIDPLALIWMYLCLWHTCHQQENAPIWAWFCSRFLPVKRAFFLPNNACWGHAFRFCKAPRDSFYCDRHCTGEYFSVSKRKPKFNLELDLKNGISDVSIWLR